jgi:hypothetical protein
MVAMLPARQVSVRVGFRRQLLRFGVALVLGAGLSTVASYGGEAGGVGQESGLSALELQYLRQLVADRLATEDLGADEQRLAGQVAERLRGVAPTPTEQADRETVEERLRELLQSRVASAPDERGPRLDLARFYLYRHQPDLAVRHLERAGPASEDDVFWPLLATYTYLQLGEHRVGGRFLSLSNLAVARLLPLRVRRALFCQRIRGLGKYEPRPEGSLRSGEAVLVYLELLGVSFRKEGKLDYRLDLTIDLAVRNEVQATVWSRPNYCNFPFPYQHPVGEVFGGFDLIVPEQLPAGKYLLVIDIRDNEGGQEATADIPFTVGGAAADE